MRIDVYIHADDHDPVTTTLGKVVAALQKVEHHMSALTDKIDELADKVAQNTTAEQSAITLLNGLSAIIADLKNGLTDQAALDKIAALETAVDAAKSDLAAAVVANTPAA